MQVTVTRCIVFAGCLAGAAWSASCAADPANEASTRPAREYRTGSNIPLKEPMPAVTAEERERTQEELRRLQRGGTATPPGSTN